MEVARLSGGDSTVHGIGERKAGGGFVLCDSNMFFARAVATVVNDRRASLEQRRV